MKRNYYFGAVFVALLIALGAGSLVLQRRATVEAAGVQAPRFEVDPMWPKPLPNHWVMGSVIGVAADANAAGIRRGRPVDTERGCVTCVTAFVRRKSLISVSSSRRRRVARPVL